jgi:hypothetical protein
LAFCLAAGFYCTAFGTGAVFRFVDIAAQTGLTVPNTFGGKYKKDLILESTGTGAAIFEYSRTVSQLESGRAAPQSR